MHAEFKFGVFLEQLVVHALFPLSLLYVLPVYGYTRARNQLFLPASCAPHLILSNILVNILMYGTPWALVVGYILHGGAYIADVSVVGTAFFVRAIVVATKVRSGPEALRAAKKMPSVSRPRALLLSTASWTTNHWTLCTTAGTWRGRARCRCACSCSPVG